MALHRVKLSSAVSMHAMTAGRNSGFAVGVGRVALFQFQLPTGQAVHESEQDAADVFEHRACGMRVAELHEIARHR